MESSIYRVLFKYDSAIGQVMSVSFEQSRQDYKANKVYSIARKVQVDELELFNPELYFDDSIIKWDVLGCSDVRVVFRSPDGISYGLIKNLCHKLRDSGKTFIVRDVKAGLNVSSYGGVELFVKSYKR